MKCQKCGQNEVNFYYSSNVNGAMTETRLCSECAQSAGYDVRSLFNSNMFGFGDMFDGLLPIPGTSRLAPRLMQCLVSQGGLNYPQISIVPIGMPVTENVNCDCGGSAVANGNAIADGELTERRMLNMEMRAAVEREDFEKAAELRDKIRELGEGI